MSHYINVAKATKQIEALLDKSVPQDVIIFCIKRDFGFSKKFVLNTIQERERAGNAVQILEKEVITR